MTPADRKLARRRQTRSLPLFEKDMGRIVCSSDSRPWSVFPAIEPAKSHIPHTMVSLFAGCGGLDLGMHYSGFRILWANDSNPDACATYRANLGEIVEDDVLKIGFPTLSDPPDLLAAGFPCQSFSNAGSRRGVKDLGGRLYLTALNAVKHFCPKAIIFENVRGLLSSRDGKKLVVEHICERLSGLGYNTYFKLLDASRHHVPQRRLRLFIIGIKSGIKCGQFAFPAEIANDAGLSLQETIFDIPSDAPNHKELLALNPQALEIGALVPEGGSWKSIPYNALPERLKRVRDNIARYRWPNFYRRFARNEVAGTITAAFKPENAGVWHPVDDRVLSVREIARIQSFPDWFVFHGRSVKSKYQQIGNAVPPRLAFELGHQLGEVLEGRSPIGVGVFIPLPVFLRSERPLRPSDPGVYLSTV
jgi:DNA (cytosine-5)-methyltransferase 1